MKQFFHIKSKSEIGPGGKQSLIEAGERYCCYALLDKKTATLHEFVYYTGEQNGEDMIASVLKTHVPADTQNGQPAIMYNLHKSTLVPSSFYHSEDSKFYLEGIFGDTVDSHIMTDHLYEQDLYNVYAVPAPVHELLNRKFTTGQYWHFHSLLLKDDVSSDADALKIDTRQNEFTVVLFLKGKLQLVQSFGYETAEDMLYYLLKICKQFSLSQPEVRLELSGFIEKDSALYRELYKYFIHIEMASLPGDIKLADAFSEYPRHYFSSICKLATCVL